MRNAFLGGALALGGLAAASPAGAFPIRVDIDSSNTGSVTTQSGFTSFNAGASATDAQNVAPLTVDGVTFTLFGGLDGSRNRAPNAVITGDPYEAVLRDFVYNDGSATAPGAAVGLRIEGLAPGTYDVQSFHYDAAANTPGSVQVELREQGVAGSTVVLVDNAPFRPEPYAYSITVDRPGQVLELVYREDDDFNRSRLNGFIISPAVPEPASAGLVLVSLGGVALGRRRRKD